jgi:hypothetical protein
MLALTTALRPPLFQRRRFCFRHSSVRRLAEQQRNDAVVAADLDAGYATGAVRGAHGTGKVALVEYATAEAAARVRPRGWQGCRHRPNVSTASLAFARACARITGFFAKLAHLSKIGQSNWLSR